MKRRQARIFAVTGAVCVALAALASLAWACTPQARMLALTPIAASPGKTVTVTGDSVTPGAAVEIRWNSAQGQPLAATSANASGSYSVAGAVPAVAPGIYYLVATAGVAGQPAPQIARIAFEVTGAAEGTQASASKAPVAAGASQLWSGFSASDANVSSAGIQTSSSPAHPGAAAGVGLLAVGAVGLISATALIARRRSKASA